MTKINTKFAGFSLIELLFAMLFLSVIVFGVIKLQTSNLTLSNTKKLELKASSYAAQGLEILDALGAGSVSGCTPECYLDDSTGPYTVQSDGRQALEVDPTSSLPLFERFFTHDESGLLSGATLVTMTVEWTDSAGRHDVFAKRIILP